LLNADGDADAAVKTRIRTGWNKFRQLVPLLTTKDISLILRRRLYSSYVQSNIHTTILLLFWNMSRTTWVSRHQKGKPGRLKPIWIYWSKR